MKVAILGGGQLARMLSMAAHRLGMEPFVIDPKPDAPAAAVAHHVLASLDDPAGWKAVAHCDVATAELDHVPPRALDWLGLHMPVHPCPSAFGLVGDRLREKRLLAELGIETAPFRPVDSLEDLLHGIDEVGLPAVLKTRFEGYDGKGQHLLRSVEDARRAWQEVDGTPAILEGWIPFDREVSMLGVRSMGGELRFWAPVENRHESGILRVSRPLEMDPDDPIQEQGRRALASVADALRCVGVLTVEFFEVDGRLLVNELACRVHNSGHWTEEGAETSQFENHLLAITGLPLGSTRSTGPTAMVNLIGDLPGRASLLSVPGARVHLYGKTPAPGRKLGHVTLRASEPAALERALDVAVPMAGASR